MFHVPAAILSTAAIPINGNQMLFFWDFATSGFVNNIFYNVLHFMELVPNTTRSFSVYLNNQQWHYNYTPPYLSAGFIYSGFPEAQPSSGTQYIWALNSSGLSDLPPILNAWEVYSPMFITQLPTNSSDVDAITAIKVQYHINRNWTGDPCAPSQFTWDGLSCSSGAGSPRILAVNLSSSALTGVISLSFSELTSLQVLDLSFNNLTGAIPASLGSLSSLQVLNLKCNNFTGPVPASLLNKLQGQLQFSFDNSTHPCILPPLVITNSTNKKKITIVVIAVVVPSVLVLILAVLFFLFRLTKMRRSSEMPSDDSPPLRIVDTNEQRLDREHHLLHAESRQFTYNQLIQITNSFARAIGRGGFGLVYHGHLENGKQVAVKILSQASKQGTREFLAEVQNLTRIHHKNLVSLVGYCMDRDHLALVYEFMSQGSLHELMRGDVINMTLADNQLSKVHIYLKSLRSYSSLYDLTVRGKHNDNVILSWTDRLQIAIDAAQGLEYLHYGCNPPIIHRDVKTSNILLGEELVAKIADFGLSRVLGGIDQTHVTTKSVVGTPGYLDPEYHNTLQLNDKSDVFSFGVVLFELITNEPPIISGQEKGHIVQRVAPKLAKGDIDDIVDKTLRGHYDANSVWKVVDLALKCTNANGSQRPTMTEVVTNLKESLQLVTANQYDDTYNISAVSHTSPFELRRLPPVFGLTPR